MADLVTTVPAAIDALVVALETAAPRPVKVVDGFPRFTLTDTDLIAVGGKPEPTAAGRWAEMAEGAFPGVSPVMETYLVSVTCRCSRGVSASQKDVRDRAFALVELVNDAVQADPTFGGVVRSAQARIGDFTLTQTSAENAQSGTFAEVVFPVELTALL